MEIKPRPQEHARESVPRYKDSLQTILKPTFASPYLPEK